MTNRAILAALTACAMQFALGSGDALAQTKNPRGALQAAMSQRQWEKVVEYGNQLVATDPDDLATWYALGYANHMLGNYDEALVAHKKGSASPTNGAVCAYNAACVYSIRDDKDNAFEWLNVAIVKGFDRADDVRADKDLDNIRDDPRFAAALARMEGKPAPEAAQPTPKFKIYDYPNERKGSRVIYFDESFRSPVQLALDYGTVEWKAEYDAKIDSGDLDNQRWRLGRDHWTNLDTSVDLRFGDVKVPAGLYYLVLARRTGGAYVLTFLDPSQIRASRVDPFAAAQTKGGIDVPMRHTVSDAVTPHLALDVRVDQDAPTEGAIDIEFGGHRLTAPMKLVLPQM